MTTTIKRAAWILFACLATHPVAGIAAQPWRHAAPAAWIDVLADVASTKGEPVEAGESDYLLVDNQVRIGKVIEHYERYVQRLVSQADVDDNAQLSIEIDPEHENIILHRVEVTRGLRVIDKLADARVSLLNRESELSSNLINGRLTLHIVPQDLRAGDIYDYSYTIERREPIAERGYSEWFDAQWSDPVRRFDLRILRPADRALQISDHGDLGAPTVTKSADWIETRWQDSNLAALPSEDGQPGWFVQFPHIEVSEFADWNAVRDWALPLYQVNAPGPALREQIELLHAEPDEAARIMKALRFVQEEIRYTGLEIGAGAFRPTPPDTVLARRYGDCKDKALLLVTLLRAVGVEAAPVLVNSTAGRGTNDRLPGPDAFDHAIAMVRHAGHDYWLDATAVAQGGNLDTIVQADFGGALVLAPGLDGLQQIPARQVTKPQIEVIETYDLRAGTRKLATLDVQTIYHDDEADGMRQKMRSTTATALGREYLEYYGKRFSGSRSTAPLTFTDDLDKNEFVTHESYAIDAPFEKSSSVEYQFAFDAYLISDRSSEPRQSRRKTPLARDLPMYVKQKVVALLPGEWNLGNENKDIRNAQIEYHSKTRFENGKLELDFELRNLTDHVPVAALKKYLADLSKIHENSYYSLSDGTDDDVPASTRNELPSGPSLKFIMALLGGVPIGILLLRWFWSMSPRVAIPPAGAPVGIDGWMWFPVLQAILAPFSLIYAISEWAESVGKRLPFDALEGAPLVYVTGTLLLIGVMLPLCIAQLVLLFRRRSSYPRLFVTMKAGFVIVAVFAVLIVGQSSNTTLLYKTIAELVGALVFSAIWCAYILMSERVKATFVRDARGEYPRAD